MSATGPPSPIAAPPRFHARGGSAVVQPVENTALQLIRQPAASRAFSLTHTRRAASSITIAAAVGAETWRSAAPLSVSVGEIKAAAIGQLCSVLRPPAIVTVTRKPGVARIFGVSMEWRRRRDSNPRGGFPPAPLAGVCLRPLGHVSAAGSSSTRRQETRGNYMSPPNKPRISARAAQAGRSRNMPRSVARFWRRLISAYSPLELRIFS